MLVDLAVTGRTEIKAASRRIREQGNPRIVRRELNRALREAAIPAVEHVKQAALHLPAKSHRGILRQRIANSVSAQSKSSGRNPNVSVRVSRAKMKDKAPVPQLMDRGPFRHPVFGREKFVTQEGHPQWFEKTVARDVPIVRERVIEAAGRIVSAMNTGH